MKILRRVLAGLAVLIVVLAGLSVWTVRRSFPEDAANLRVPGLTAPVTVRWDGHGIPQVYADNAADLFRAQGYVHARDRFWEMDFRRHVTSGRLAELFGADELKTDEYLRTMGWRRVAEQEYAQAPADVRANLRAYADGVNAWLAGHSGASASLEYAVLKLSNPGYRIERWSPVDSVAWLKAMAWDLKGNMDAELTRAGLLAAGLTRAQIDDLYPPFPADHTPIVPTPATPPGVTGRAADLPLLTAPAAGDVLDGLHRIDALVGLPRGPDGAGIGSNSWVVSGRLTTTGRPILANDPHLSVSMPGIWYQMGLHCSCGYDVAGFTFAGLPGVVIGHNARIAWGFTNLDPDVIDMYVERVDGDRYLVDGQWVPLTTRRETFRVAGGPSRTITVRSTRHGPLLSDVSADLRDVAAKPGVPVPDGGPTALAMSWTALSPGHTIEALFAIDRAADWTDFRAAAAMFDVPAQNMVYADVDGNIGYQAPGRVPVRGKGDGRYPAPGWDSAYDWKSYVPFDALPHELNPAQGYIATANQEVVPPSYPVYLTQDWGYGFRSQRINDLIAGHSAPLSVADVGAMQFDNRNNGAVTVVPKLLAIHVTGRVAAAQALLRHWDFQEPTGSAPAAFYNATWRALLRRTFDEVPAKYAPDGGERWFEVVRRIIDQPDNPWWDDHRTSTVEHRDDVLRAAMRDAADELTNRLGPDPSAWRWGDLHRLELTNQTFGKSGIAPIEWLFNSGPYAAAGGGGIVDAAAWDASQGYDVIAGPSMRMVVDLADLDRSTWIQLTGNSAHAFSAHYADQVELWRAGRSLAWAFSPPAVRRATELTQTLRP